MIRHLKIDKCLHYIYNLSTSRMLSKSYQNLCYNPLNYQVKCFSGIVDENIFGRYENTKKKKTRRLPQVKLIHPNDTITINLLEEAQRIAKHQHLHLVKQSGTDAHGREVYKLCNETELCEEESSQTTNEVDVYKNTKLFTIKSKITDHDLQIKINNINKTLMKIHKTKILIIFANEQDDKEDFINKLKKKVEGGNLSETKKKGNSITLVYLPTSIVVEKNKSSDE